MCCRIPYKCRRQKFAFCLIGVHVANCKIQDRMVQSPYYPTSKSKAKPMSNSTATPPVPEASVAWLRTNLRAAGIPFTEADIEGILAKGFLSRLASFEALMAQTPTYLVP